MKHHRHSTLLRRYKKSYFFIYEDDIVANLQQRYRKQSRMEEKIKKLDEATTASQLALLDAESKLAAASNALEAAKSRLKRLSPEAQQNIQFNDTELPDLISAKIEAETECENARKRYETNEKYLTIIREKHVKSGS